MYTHLNQVEKDYIEFMSLKRSRPQEEIEKLYISLRQRFRFNSFKYQKLLSDIRHLFSLSHDAKDERETIDSIRLHELPEMLRHISFGFPKTIGDYFYETLRLLKKGQFWSIGHFAKRKLTGRSSHAGIANFLLEKLGRPPVVVDYGCGMGYLSFEIARQQPAAKTYLLDIDSLRLEFTEFRFKKNNFDTEVIKVTKENLYPHLPKHNICIATEVMEHIFQPLTVYENIRTAMEPGGILYGNFSDHDAGLFHVSPSLQDLREQVARDFNKIDFMTYMKTT